MNERIKELAKQAGAETWSQPPLRAVTGLAFTDEALQKFAELLIEDQRETINKQAHNMIKKHFGVGK
jgi:hypothetical protein